ncbi:MAG: disulfide bond formation protein DsbA [Acidimicrobiales bacterium]|nr:thioredoxin domain-containing protein [Hyphomonadaceae bacterium]RZV35923.1 MAG: disulfide bond formation protein DsbA [Acidimicrobiales bacterium]
MRALSKTTTAITFFLVLSSFSGCAEAGPADKAEIEKIVKEYLLENPEIIREALVVLQEREDKASITNVAKELRNDPRDFSIGPKDAKVTMVEFFDYNCTYCKKSTDWVQKVIKQHPEDVRVVFKELPILDGRTRTSRNAAKAAMAAQRQGKYFEMHLALMDSSVLSKDFINKTAKKLGLDMDKFAADMKDKALDAQLESALILANRIPGLTGTPFFVINDEFLASGNTRALQVMLDKALKESS